MVNIPTPKLIKISKVKTHPNNVKKHPETQIKNLMQLMKWVGFKDPIVLDKNLEVKAGHGRLIAAKRLGMDKVPYVELEGLTKKQMDLFIYMDNQINESPWIKENVQLLLQEIPMKDLEMFDIEWGEKFKLNYPEETDPVPDPPKITKSKLRQIYQLDNHRIMCGDSTTDIEYLMKDMKCDLVVTDPPYGVGYEQGKFTGIPIKNKFEPIKNDEKRGKELQKFIEEIFSKIKLYLKNSPIYVFSPPMQESFSILQGLINSGFRVQSQIIWCKNQFILGRNDYHWQHEIIWYGYLGKNHYWCGDRTQSTLWNIPRDPSNTYEHPTQKPTKLAQRAIVNSSKKNQVVLDPFLGSGSTLIACEQTGRTCYGMELDPGYVDVIIQRWENFTGKKAKLITEN